MRNDRADDTSRFMQAIAAFSAEPEAVTAHGRLIAQGPNPALPCVLTEITETVLRRYLHFTTDTGHAACLDVAERRVLAVKNASGCFEGDFTDILDRDLSDNHAPRLLHLLGQLQGSVYVRAGLPAKSAGTRVIGVSVSDLERAQSAVSAADQLPATLADVMERFASSCIAAVAYIDGQLTLTQGSGSLCDPLATVCIDHPLEQTNTVVLWHGLLAQDNAVLSARCGSVSIGLVVPAADMFACFSALHGAVTADV